MKRTFHLVVNGQRHEFASHAHQTLCDALREDLRLTGTKHGCDLGDCGACTVLVDGRPILSCITLLADVDGKDIQTIEGVADGSKLHPLQRAFDEKGAAQCGYCTPGFIMSGVHLLEIEPHPNRETIQHALSGNLCRCTGYTKIIEAVESVANRDRDHGNG